MEVRDMGSGAFCVRIERGEEVIASLTEFARERGFYAGSLTAIGAVADRSALQPDMAEMVDEDLLADLRSA